MIPVCFFLISAFLPLKSTKLQQGSFIISRSLFLPMLKYSAASSIVNKYFSDIIITSQIKKAPKNQRFRDFWVQLHTLPLFPSIPNQIGIRVYAASAAKYHFYNIIHETMCQFHHSFKYVALKFYYYRLIIIKSYKLNIYATSSVFIETSYAIRF